MSIKCKLCNKEFDDSKITKEHYPAKSAGNNDLVLINVFNLKFGWKFVL